jgi:hypothetical protein
MTNSRALHKLKPFQVAKKDKPKLLCDGGGLRLVTPAEASRWVFRYQANGKRHDIGLGSLRNISLSEARDKAAELRRRRRDGEDLMADKRGRVESMTLNAATNTFLVDN